MTAQENDIPTHESQTDGGAAFEQGDIDSMFDSDASSEKTSDQGAVSAQNESTPADEPATDEASIDQSSIDAMFGGDETAEPQEAAIEPAPADAAEGGAAVVDQSDIDALFGGADSDDAPSSEPAAQDTRVDTLGRPFDAAAAEMAAAIAEEKEAAAAAAPPPPPPPPPVQTEAVSLEDFGNKSAGAIDPRRVSMLSDVKLRVRVELGRSRMLVEDVLQLGEGSVVELQKAAGDPVDIIVNERLIARGEVLVLNDNFCVRISEIVATDPHRVTV